MTTKYFAVQQVLQRAHSRETPAQHSHSQPNPYQELEALLKAPPLAHISLINLEVLQRAARSHL
jgi:hypothetical protein